METWDRYDILMTVLATGAILCLTTALIAVLGHMLGSLIELVDSASGEPLSVRIASGVIAGIIACFLTGTGLLAITLTWKVWTLP